MAKKKKNTRKKASTRKPKAKANLFSRVVKFLRSDGGRLAAGVVIIFFALYLFVAMLSFFKHGNHDASFVGASKVNGDCENTMGYFGAWISQKLVNEFMGVCSLIIPLYLFYFGLRYARIFTRSLLFPTLFSAIFLIFGSVSAAFAQSLIEPQNPSVAHWGGLHGEGINRFLISLLGQAGVWMAIILLLVLIIVISRRMSADYIKKILPKSTPKDNVETPVHKKSIWQRINEWIAIFKPEDDDDDEEDAEEESDDANEVHGKHIKQKENDENDSLQEGAHESDYGNIPSNPHIYSDPEFTIDAPAGENAVTPTNGEAEESAPPAVEPDVLPTNPQGEEFDPTSELSTYQKPSLELLKLYENTNKEVDMEEQRANKNMIIKTLRNFGVEITRIHATVGPTVTLYEIKLQDGVRISKVKNLENDIAMSLAALGIRIIAPMPGRGTIGIEVPNKDPQIVSMQSLIASASYRDTAFDLPVALGKTITNDVFMFDLCKMPHLLVAGATGQGKSVGLNAIITSLLYKKHPAEMKMVLVDPKMVEFNIYSTIEKHYLAKLPDAEKAIITDVSKVTQTLQSLTKEMDDRYELMMAAGVRNIKEYNQRFKEYRLNKNKGHRFMPYIVILIDEFGDLIMQAGKEIELPIARIAQKARAVGMHMVIATQRPTVNIITGTIKANFPARIAFKCSTGLDSRTILDKNGAEQLIGRGDMLFSNGSDLVRLQCAFVDTPEVEGITQYIGRQQGYDHAFELPEYVGDVSDVGNAAADLRAKDEFFEEAAYIVVSQQEASASNLQRKLEIGFARAAKIIDQLEAAGIIGPKRGPKPREVLITDEIALRTRLEKLRQF